MPKELPPVEACNALELDSYASKLLPEIFAGLTYTSPKLNAEYHITLSSSHSITGPDLDRCFAILTFTSKEDYAASREGWHPKRKLKEMKLPDMRYLLARPSASDLPEGFASFMLTYEDGKEVVYLYEIHLQGNLRGSGLGRLLMNLVEEAGRRAGMEKSMLTVYRANMGARQFYGKLGYVVDEYSPEPKRLRSGVIKEPDYEILSKAL